MMETVENSAEFGNDPQGLVRRWKAALELARKEQDQWVKRAEKVIKRYKDERSELDDSKKFNILWSNIETITPALYSRLPEPKVSRRHKDQDPVGRQAAMVLERALEYHLDAYDFDSVPRSAVEDYLLPGRGVARVKYNPTFGEEITPIERIDFDEMGNPVPVAGEPYSPVIYEEAQCEYVYWKDFLHGPGRKWEDVSWVAFRSYLSRDQLVERFGEEMGGKVKLDWCPSGIDDETPKDVFKKAKVWEIWDKDSGKVIWISETHDLPLDHDDPPLNLSGFFPCPKPLLSITTNDSLIPVPEYTMYQDQAEELDELTGRIASLVKSLKVAGVYAGDADELKQLLNDGTENVLIPVENWAMFADKSGGLANQISWLPIDQIINVVIGLYDAREKTKEELYEITGLADIIRGASKASETATAQKMKGNFASMRLSERQKAVANWVRDLLRLKCEVIAEQFDPQTLQMMTGLQVTDEVIELMRTDPLRAFRIDIETDSTIQPDEQMEKQSRMEFLEAVGTFMERSLGLAQAVPEMAPLLGEMLMFGVRGFRAGRELEDQMEQALQALQNRPQQQDQGDPVEEAKAAKIQQDMQLDQAKFQHEVQQDQREFALEAQETQHDMAIDRMKANADLRSQV